MCCVELSNVCIYSIHVYIINVVVFTTQPMDVTVCLTQSTTATFTCVVDRGGIAIFTAGWHTLESGRYVLVPDNGKPRHMVNRSVDVNEDTITDILIVTDVSVNDNGTLYRCQPLNDEISMPVTITVLGEVAIYLSCPYKQAFIYEMTQQGGG